MRMRIYFLFLCLDLEVSCPEQSKTSMFFFDQLPLTYFPKITKCGRLLSLVMKVCHIQEFLRLYSAFLLRCVFLCQCPAVSQVPDPGLSSSVSLYLSSEPNYFSKTYNIFAKVSPSP